MLYGVNRLADAVCSLRCQGGDASKAAALGSPKSGGTLRSASTWFGRTGPICVLPTPFAAASGSTGAEGTGTLTQQVLTHPALSCHCSARLHELTWASTRKSGMSIPNQSVAAASPDVVTTRMRCPHEPNLPAVDECSC